MYVHTEDWSLCMCVCVCVGGVCVGCVCAHTFVPASAEGLSSFLRFPRIQKACGAYGRADKYTRR